MTMSLKLLHYINAKSMQGAISPFNKIFLSDKRKSVFPLVAIITAKVTWAKGVLSISKVSGTPDRRSFYQFAWSLVLETSLDC